MNPLDPTSPDSFVHIIQLSLSPIFLLTAVASLLSVFTSRLARISDQVKSLSSQSVADDEPSKRMAKIRFRYLQRRTYALDAAVILATISGGCTCGVVLTLFFGILHNKATLGLLMTLFGGGIVCTIGALGCFLSEVMLASRGIRAAVSSTSGSLEW